MSTNNYNPSLVFIQETIEREGIEEGKRKYFDYLQGNKTNAWTGRVMKRPLDRLAPGQALLRRALEPCAEAVLEWFLACATGKAGPGSKAAVFLAPFFERDTDDLLTGARQLAFMTLKTVLSYIGESRNGCVMAIAKGVQDELEMEIFRQAKSQQQLDDNGQPRELEGLFFHVLHKFQKQTSNAQHRAKVMKGIRTQHGVEGLGWDNNTRVAVGGRLFNIVASLTGWFEQVEELNGFVGRHPVTKKPISKSEVTLQPTAALAEVLDHAHLLTAIQEPVFPPMIVPPRDWETPYTGGYLTEELSRKVPLIKTSNPQLLTELAARGSDLAPVYAAVNALQRVAFKINTRVLEVATYLHHSGKEVDGLPATQPKRVPDRPCAKEDIEAFKAANPEAWKAYVKSVKDAHDFNNAPRRAGDLMELQRVLAVAENYKSYEHIYFPLQLDFRGRVYPVPSYLHPQGSDLCKGLLTFGEGKALGERGHIWLAITGANAFAVKGKDDPWLLERTGDRERSLDKCDFTTRYEWILENEAKILLSAEHPMDCLWWTEADAPFQFLAFCLEWKGYREEGEDFVSHLPCPADGACNGIQHWSAIMRCEETAPKVCLVPTDVPGDIYSDVANAARELVRADLGADDGETRALASFWLPKINRSLMKRAVMTSPYGLTSYGMRKQFSKMLKDEEKGDADFQASSKDFQKVALTYLNRTAEAAMEKAVSSASVGMAWLKVVADALAADGLPIHWTTPDGLTVWQGYPETKSTKIRTYLQGEVAAKSQSWKKVELVNEETGEVNTQLDTADLGRVVGAKTRGVAMIITVKENVPGKLSRAKNKNSVAPNVVHSLDAAAMRGMVRKAEEAGVHNVMTVHDSFATHAADYETLAGCTREAFVEMHSGDFLATWFDQVTAAMEDDRLEKLKATLTEQFGDVLPKKGNLDLQLVLDSDYFFA